MSPAASSDSWSSVASASSGSKQPKPKAGARKATGSNGRLRTGELDGLVLAYMRKHQDELPLSASAIAKGTGRSGGAVANCLGPGEEKGGPSGQT